LRAGNNYNIRQATVDDAAALAGIYAPYVTDTVISFELIPPTPAEFAERIRALLGLYPYLVLETEGRIAGYAYAARHMARAAYQWNAELSVYIHRDFTGQGFGSVLYQALMDLSGAMGLINLYGCVATPNPASEKLHARLGFTLVGVFPRTGFKFGRWHDVSWFGTSLAAPGADLAPPLSFKDVPEETVRKILAG